MSSIFAGINKPEDSHSSVQLQQALEQTIKALSLKPLNNVPPTPEEVIIKSAPAYYVSTGVLNTSEEPARTNIVNTLRSQNWTIIHHGKVDHFLGWEVVATRNSAVLQISAGEEARGVSATPYTRQNGYTYIQVAIAGQNSGPSWSVIQ